MKKLLFVVLALNSVFALADEGKVYSHLLSNDKDIKCVKAVTKLDCGSDKEFLGLTTFSCDIKVEYQSTDDQIKEVIGRASSFPISLDRDSSIVSLGAYGLNAVGTPFRALKAKANRNDLINEIQNSFSTCEE